MDFNTQVCTTREQSFRLLAIGLKPETADMVWRNEVVRGKEYSTLSVVYALPILSQDTPAWSLQRLMVIGEMQHMGFNDLRYAYDVCIEHIRRMAYLGRIHKDYLL